MSNEKYKMVQKLIQGLDEEARTYLETYFENAPQELLNSFSIVEYPKNHIFIKEGEKVQYIHILVKGFVKATDYRIHGAMYDFMWFSPVKTFGALEVITDIDCYKTTLMTTTPCTVLIVERPRYEKWIRSDVNALYMESNSNMVQLLKQTRRERIYLFMQGTDRMGCFLQYYYDQFQERGTCTVKLTRQDMCDCTGLSIKTVNRAITQLEEMKCIAKIGSKIVMKAEHYKVLQQYLSELVEQ